MIIVLQLKSEARRHTEIVSVRWASILVAKFPEQATSQTLLILNQPHCQEFLWFFLPLFADYMSNPVLCFPPSSAPREQQVNVPRITRQGTTSAWGLAPAFISTLKPCGLLLSLWNSGLFKFSILLSPCPLQVLSMSASSQKHGLGSQQLADYTFFLFFLIIGSENKININYWFWIATDS